MKNFMIIAAAALVGASAYGQGTINFNNRVTAAGINAPVTYAGAPAAGDTFLAQLWGGAPGSEMQAIGPAVPFRTGGLAGFINAGVTDSNPTGATRNVPGVPGGGSVEVQIRAWATEAGDTWEEAIAFAGGAGTGTSETLTITLGGAGVPPSLPADLVGLDSFAITVVPEPSIAALGLLGAGLLLIRRKK